MEGCKAPGAPCNTETNDTNCCYAFGTYKCMGDPGKQKCEYAPSSLLNMSDDISGDDSSSDDNVAKVTSTSTMWASDGSFIWGMTNEEVMEYVRSGKDKNALLSLEDSRMGHPGYYVYPDQDEENYLNMYSNDTEVNNETIETYF